MVALSSFNGAATERYVQLPVLISFNFNSG